MSLCRTMSLAHFSGFGANHGFPSNVNYYGTIRQRPTPSCQVQTMPGSAFLQVPVTNRNAPSNSNLARSKTSTFNNQATQTNVEESEPAHTAPANVVLEEKKLVTEDFSMPDGTKKKRTTKSRYTSSISILVELIKKSTFARRREKITFREPDPLLDPNVARPTPPPSRTSVSTRLASQALSDAQALFKLRLSLAKQESDDNKAKSPSNVPKSRMPSSKIKPSASFSLPKLTTSQTAASLASVRAFASTYSPKDHHFHNLINNKAENDQNLICDGLGCSIKPERKNKDRHKEKTDRKSKSKKGNQTDDSKKQLKHGNFVNKELPSRTSTPVNPSSPTPSLVLRKPPPIPSTQAPNSLGHQSPRPFIKQSVQVVKIQRNSLPPPPLKPSDSLHKSNSILANKPTAKQTPQTRSSIQRSSTCPCNNKNNVLIKWTEPDVEIAHEIHDFGILQVDPKDYVRRYGVQLTPTHTLVELVAKHTGQSVDRVLSFLNVKQQTRNRVINQ